MDNNQPLISIIMPVYGVELYLKKAIESVIHQLYSNWELLIINDGSIDNSRKIAEYYSKKYNNIYLYDKKNGGLSDARNYGLNYVKGKYIHFFDSDDFIDNDLYSTYIPIIEKSQNDFIIFGFQTQYLNSKGESYSVKRMNPATVHYKNLDRELLLEEYSVFLNFAWNKIFNASFLKENNLTFKKGLSVIEDQEFFSRVISITNNFSFVSGIKYHYMVRPRKTLSSTYNSSFLDLYRDSFNLSQLIFSKMEIPECLLKSKMAELAYYKFYYLIIIYFQSSNNISKKEFLKILGDDFFRGYYKDYRPNSILHKMLRRAFLSRREWLYFLFYLRFRIFLKQ